MRVTLTSWTATGRGVEQRAWIMLRAKSWVYTREHISTGVRVPREMACTHTYMHAQAHPNTYMSTQPPPWCMRTHPWLHTYHSRLHTYHPHVHTHGACTHLSPHSYSSQVSSLQVQVGPQAPGIFLHVSGEESGHVTHPWLQTEGERRGEERAGQGRA